METGSVLRRPDTEPLGQQGLSVCLLQVLAQDPPRIPGATRGRTASCSLTPPTAFVHQSSGIVVFMRS